jgi:bacillithiol biosynthesis cysteine-adding enzyme BshC
MLIHNVSLPLMNRLANDYLLGKAEAMQFFQYPPYQMDSYLQRLRWLRDRAYPHRDRLADGLSAYNLRIGNDEAALAQIERLRKPDACVVIGGQQAGVLTGPLYTIHKAVHLIQTARKLEAELNTAVVPVFWVAGEDHDMDEINHLYLAAEGETRLKKIKLDLKKKGRISASQMPLDLADCERLIEAFFREHTETAYTSTLRELLAQTAEQADTVADWFACIMARLFGKHGLVFVESSSPYVRELEQPVFRQLIEQNEQISALLGAMAKQIAEAGYPLQLQIDDRQANLFLYEGPDRLLLERAEGRFWTKDRRSSYSGEELLALLETNPERFSANVVSRPLMQEHLFPTLAFIAGPGEIAYWAFYKQNFALFGYQLPVILPRLSVTFVEAAIERTLGQLGLELENVLGNFYQWKREWLEQVEENRFRDRFAETREKILQAYQPLVEEVISAERGLKQLAEKNVQRLIGQIDFLQQQVQRSQRKKHEVSLKRLERVEMALRPEGVWQERIFTFFTFANKYGLDLIDRLVEAPFSFDGTHKAVYL